jgi:hypothetical protein
LALRGDVRALNKNLSPSCCAWLSAQSRALYFLLVPVYMWIKDKDLAQGIAD